MWDVSICGKNTLIWKGCHVDCLVIWGVGGCWFDSLEYPLCLNIDSLWPSGPIYIWQIIELKLLILVQVMAWCLFSSTLLPKSCWLTVNWMKPSGLISMKSVSRPNEGSFRASLEKKRGGLLLSCCILILISRKFALRGHLTISHDWFR